MDSLEYFKCLADDTRLRIALLLSRGELCVCELVAALDTSQPKISRHLAQLRRCGLLATRRDGLWVYYRIADDLPAWAAQVLAAAEEGYAPHVSRCCERLDQMADRPTRCEAVA